MYYILLQEFDEQHGQKARTRSICRSLFAAGVVSTTVYISLNVRFMLLVVSLPKGSVGPCVKTGKAGKC